MKKLMFALAGATALSTASIANAAITIGTTGTTAGSTFAITNVDNVGVPQTVDFRTTTDTGGAYTSFFDFSNTDNGFYNFSLITSTLGGTVTLAQLLTGGGSTVLQTSTGSSNSLSLLTGNLTAGTTYRFSYTSNFPTGGGTTSGNASFYVAVPEPATWALMLLGFGGMGMVLRRRRRPALAQIA
jgi:hypothetical protein